eukprot:COSAG01_NODE_7988_length_2963_cov_1.445880_2_plen_82_part_00
MLPLFEGEKASSKDPFECTVFATAARRNLNQSVAQLVQCQDHLAKEPQCQGGLSPWHGYARGHSTGHSYSQRVKPQPQAEL